MILALSPEGIITKYEGFKNFIRFAYDTIGTNMVERIPLTEAVEMWLDEEATLKQNPKINHYAMLVAIMISGRALRQNLYGTVIFTGPGNSDLILSDEGRAAIYDLLNG